MDSIIPVGVEETTNKSFNLGGQNDLRNRLIKSINSLLPIEGHALHKAAKIHFQDHGKLLRGVTVLMLAQALGVKKRSATNWALAIELMHNASLIHDDICDGDICRRKNNTVWSVISERTAICFGDWLVAQSFELAIESALSSETKNIEVVRALTHTMLSLCEGQSSEFDQKPILSWKNYDKHVLAKTSSLIVAAGEGPLLLAGVVKYKKIIKKALNCLGIAYQINNDINDVTGENIQTSHSDLTRRAPNAVSVAFNSLLLSSEKSNFINWLLSEDTVQTDHWIQQFIDAGAIKVCKMRSIELVQEAKELLDQIPEEIRLAFCPLIFHLERSSQSQCD